MSAPGFGVMSASRFALDGTVLDVPRDLRAVWSARPGGLGAREARLLFIGGRLPIFAAPGFRLGLHASEDRAARAFVAWLSDRSAALPPGWELVAERWSVCTDCGRIHEDAESGVSVGAGVH